MTQTIATPAPAADPARIVVLLCALAQIGAALLPVMGIGTPVGERSDAVQTLITPAGWAFSIWGALYLGSLVFLASPVYVGRGAIAPCSPRCAGRQPVLFSAMRSGPLGVQLGDIDAVSTLIIFGSLVSILIAYRRIAAWDGALFGGRALGRHPAAVGARFLVDGGVDRQCRRHFALLWRRRCARCRAAHLRRDYRRRRSDRGRGPCAGQGQSAFRARLPLGAGSDLCSRRAGGRCGSRWLQRSRRSWC